MGDELVRVVEAIYAIQIPEHEWLGRIADAARPLLDDGFGTCAYLYATDGASIRAWGSVTCGSFPFSRETFQEAIATCTADAIRDSFLVRTCVNASEVRGWHEQPACALFQEVGIGDVFAVNAYDPTGVGCWLGALVREPGPLATRQRQRWSRVSRHLAAAFRLRRRLGGGASAANAEIIGRSDAVVTPGGRIEDMREDAVDEASAEALRRAVLALERVRSRRERRDGEAAVAQWSVRVSARWSLLDAFESDGRRYVVAVSNAPAARGAVALARRERQVLVYAALGHTNKLIAYELGLSASTVRVLLARAAKKLGVSTRAEAIAVFRAHERRSAT